MRLATLDNSKKPSDLNILTAHNWWLAYETEDKKTDKNEVEKTTSYIMDQKDGELGNYYLACSDHNNNVPIASLMLSYEYNIIEDKYCHWFQSVYVRDQYRSKGIFTNMFKEVEKLGLEKDHNKVKLYVETENDKAIATYEKRGMYKLDNHIVMEFDGVFAFGTKKANIASTKANCQKFLNTMKAKLSAQNIILEMKLASELGTLRILKIEDCKNLDSYNWKNLRNILGDYANLKDEASDKEISSDYLRRIKKNLLGQHKWGSCWIVDKQLSDQSYELVGVFTTLQEYSDWRSGNMHWLYDARVDEKYHKNSELCNFLLLHFVKNFFTTAVNGDSVLKVLRV